MFVAMRNARVNDKFQDSLYLFLELVRAGVMHGHLWSGRAFSGGPSFGTGTGNPFPRFSVVLLTSAFSLFSRFSCVRLWVWRGVCGFFFVVVTPLWVFFCDPWRIGGCASHSELDPGRHADVDGLPPFLHPDDEKSCMLLVMRVLSIVPLSFKVL